MKTIQEIIDYMKATPEDSWCTDVVRTDSKNCFFGHLFSMGKDDKESNVLWGMFEELYATTYMLYPVNDGSHPDYPQTTAKARVIAYLEDLRDGKAKTTYQVMEDYEADFERERQNKTFRVKIIQFPLSNKHEPFRPLW